MGVQILTVSIRNSWKWKAIQGRVRASLYYREVAVVLTPGLFPAGLGGGGAAFALAPVAESQSRDIPSLPAAAGKKPPKSGHLISGFCH